MRLSWKAFSVMADIPVSALVTCLEQVEEPRIDRAQRPAWRDILVLGVRATICGADHLVAIEDFGQANEAWLRTFLALPHGIPAHDTVGRGRARRDAAQWETCLLDWVQSAFTLAQGQVVAVDGTSVRRSRDAGRGSLPCPGSAPGSRPTVWFGPHRRWRTDPTTLPPYGAGKRPGGIGSAWGWKPCTGT